MPEMISHSLVRGMRRQVWMMRMAERDVRGQSKWVGRIIFDWSVDKWSNKQGGKQVKR
jgi:hypothetical protein